MLEFGHFGAGHLGWHEGATLGAESVQVRGYILGKRRGNLVEADFLALSLRS